MHVRVQGHTARFDANGNLGELEGGVLALGVAHPDDGEAVRLAIDDEEPIIVGSDSNRGRPAGGEERGRVGEAGGEGDAGDDRCRKAGGEP
jgi:hypothetical protein